MGKAHRPFGSITVIGLGYIGLPTAATIAATGISVNGIDIRKDVVEELNEGRAHFSEPDLDTLVRKAVADGNLRAFTEPQAADAFIITVPTPILDDKSPDMHFVETAARDIAPVLESGNLVILESTSPVGTTDRLAQIIADTRPNLVRDGSLDVLLAYCPERILPGQMVRELIENDRVVGGLNDEATARATELYRLFVRGEVLETNARTAELVKLIENAYRDVNIAFANEVANIGDAHDLDPYEAIALANHHPRVNILSPGPGVGGHCIAVDPWFLISQNKDLSGLMAQARRVNDNRPDAMIAKVENAAEFAGSKRLACLGLAFKPNVDDLRESPAVEIVAKLAERGYAIAAVEPHVDALPAPLAELDNVSLTPLADAIASSDVVVLLVAHSAFSNARPDLAGQAIVDTVGLWR